MKFWGLQRRAPLSSTWGDRLYAIGDVHGCFDLLTHLLQLIEHDLSSRAPKEARLVMLGDYVDRGPQSRDVCELLFALASEGRAICLRGNHEQVMLDVLDGDESALRFWLEYGGEATLRSWDIPEKIIDEAWYAVEGAGRLISQFREMVNPQLVEWLRGLPIYYMHGDYLFVHAGIRPRITLEDQTEQDMLWIRQPFLQSRARHPWKIIHGHSEFDEVQNMSNRVGIDTGAYRTGVLTALGLEDEHCWTVQTSGNAALGLKPE